MSRRILSAFLALMMIAGVAVVSKADVQGSFELHILMEPMGTQTESVKFFFDIQSNLVLNITLSGLTFGADLGFGTTGIEFAVISLTTNLGALAVNDTFVFAEPFACFSYPNGVGNDLNDEDGSCVASNIYAIGDGNGDGIIDRAVGFVKKRIHLELNIAGITLSNLAIFEDVDFPDLQGGTDHEHDHFGPGVVYDLSSINSTVDDQTPTYGFGDQISVSGQTVSGITVSGSTDLCMNSWKVNYIKKRNWMGEVNKACTAQLGNVLDTPLEGGAKTPLLFEKEDLSIEGIELGGIIIDVFVTFKPLEPISATITASFDVLDFASVSVVFTSNNITALTLEDISITVISDNLSLTLTDEGGDLQIDETTAVLDLILNPNQNPAALTITLVAGTDGLTSASILLAVSRGILELSVDTSFDSDGDGGLTWAGTDFSLSVDYGNGFALTASLGFSPSGMTTTEFTLGVDF